MSRTVMARKPTVVEFRRLNRLVHEAETPRQQRRAYALVLHFTGMQARDIAEALEVHPNTIYADLHAFQENGLAAVERSSSMGAPTRIPPKVADEIRRIAEIAPYELGLPYGRWSLATLRAYLIQKHVVKKISREHLRQLLKKRGFGSFAFSADCSAPIRNDRPFYRGFERSGGTDLPGAGSSSSMCSRSR